MRPYFYVPLAIVATILPASAYAANPAAPVMADLQASLNEIPALEKGMADITRASESLLKENRVLNANRTEQIARKNALNDNFSKKLDSLRAERQAEITKVWDEYAATGCTGTLETPKYDACVASEPSYKARTSKKAADWEVERKALNDNFQSSTIKPIQDVISRQTKGIDDIAGKIKGNLDSFTASQKKLELANLKIASLRKILNVICYATDATQMTLSTCNRVNWDGTRTDLPPLGPVKKPLNAEPNN